MEDSKSQISALFKSQVLFDLALTHKSWVNEHPNQRRSNERLEFLGDAVLEFITSKELYQKFPDKDEGYLTALRANLVNTTNLAHVAKKLQVGQMIYLSKGEEDGGGRENKSLLADTVEAIIGALYLDGGIAKAQEFIEKNLFSDLAEKLEAPLKDPKSRLQECVQAKGFEAPKYQVVKEKGPDHHKEFIIQVSVAGKALAKGSGKNKSDAAQKAARKTLDKISKGVLKLT